MKRASSRWKWATLLALVGMLVTLGGCGSGGGSTGGSTGGDTSGGAGNGDTTNLGLKEGGAITFGSNIAYAPFEYVDPQTSQPTGFDIELGEAIAEELGVETHWVDNPSFDALIPNLQNGQYDAVISAMTITPEREKVVEFTDGYNDADQALIVHKGSGIESAADLNSSTVIGVQQNTTSSAYTEKHFGGKVAEIRTYNGTPESLEDLAVGRVDAVITDIGAGAYAVKTEYGQELELVDRFKTSEELGIAVRKGNTSLLDALNQTLSKLRSSGTIEELEKKWLGGTEG